MQSVPSDFSSSSRPPGCRSRNSDTSWMKPATRTSGRVRDSSLTDRRCKKRKEEKKSKGQVGHEQEFNYYLHVSQLITGRSSDFVGQEIESCSLLSRFNVIASSPLRISFSGNFCKCDASPRRDKVQRSHFVGSYWYHLTAFR